MESGRLRAAGGRPRERGGGGAGERPAGGAAPPGPAHARRLRAQQGVRGGRHRVRRGRGPAGGGARSARAGRTSTHAMTQTKTTSELKARMREAAAAVRASVKLTPELGIILGTGLGDLSQALDGAAVVPYASIPHFPRSTVESHAGELHVGRLAGRPVAVMK